MDMLKEIKILEDEMNKIKEKIDKLKEDYNNIDGAMVDGAMVRKGDTYYYLTDEGEICSNIWANDAIDNARLSFGNVMRTREEALFKSCKIEIKNILKKYAEPDDYEWDGENDHYYFNWDCMTNQISIFKATCLKTEGTTYFASGEKAREALDKIGENELIAYLFSKESEEDV